MKPLSFVLDRFGAGFRKLEIRSVYNSWHGTVEFWTDAEFAEPEGSLGGEPFVSLCGINADGLRVHISSFDTAESARALARQLGAYVDPAAVVGVIVSLEAEACNVDASISISEAYDGMDQFQREMMRVACEFEAWSWDNFDYEVLEDPWSYLLADRFGAVLVQTGRTMLDLADLGISDWEAIGAILKTIRL